METPLAAFLIKAIEAFLWVDLPSTPGNPINLVNSNSVLMIDLRNVSIFPTDCFSYTIPNRQNDSYASFKSFLLHLFVCAYMLASTGACVIAHISESKVSLQESFLPFPHVSPGTELSHKDIWQHVLFLQSHLIDLSFSS